MVEEVIRERTARVHEKAEDHTNQLIRKAVDYTTQDRRPHKCGRQAIEDLRSD